MFSNDNDLDEKTWLMASKNGQREVIAHFIQQGVEINYQNQYGRTALMEAAENGHHEIVQDLLDVGANLNAHSRYHRTALMEAANNNHHKVVKILLNAGAHINFQNLNGFTALMEAASGGHGAIIRELLEHGAQINVKSEKGFTALMLAAKNNNIYIIDGLINYGADVNITNLLGKDALMIAVEFGNYDVARKLLNKGANVNSRSKVGQNALMSAARSGSANIVRLLLKAGFQVNALDNFGCNALKEAICHSQNRDVVRILLGSGANPNFLKNAYPLNEASQRGEIEMVHELLNHGANLNFKSTYGRTALMDACLSGHVELVQYLLDQGADINVRDENGKSAFGLSNSHEIKAILAINFINKFSNLTLLDRFGAFLGVAKFVEKAKDLQEAKNILHNPEKIVGLEKQDRRGLNESDSKIASKNINSIHNSLLDGDLRNFKRLLDCNLDLNSLKYDLSPLMIAARSNNLEAVKSLLKKGAEVNLVNSMGSSALIFAASLGYNKIVRCLIENGADVNILDKNNFNALNSAVLDGYREIVSDLLASGVKINHGRSALAIASQIGYVGIAKDLLERGANVNVRDAQGASIFSKASAEMKEILAPHVMTQFKEPSFFEKAKHWINSFIEITKSSDPIKELREAKFILDEKDKLQVQQNGVGLGSDEQRIPHAERVLDSRACESALSR